MTKSKDLPYGSNETKELIIETLPKMLGNITKTAEALGICKETIYNYRRAYPEVSEAIKEGKRHIGEEVENAFYQNAIGTDGSKGNIAAQIFFLKTQKGWVETRKVIADVTTAERKPEDIAKFEEMLADWKDLEKESAE